MENRRGDVSEHESACARVAAQFPQRWLRGYVRSKLRRDPIYPAAYELFRGSDEPILDIGCGRSCPKRTPGDAASSTLIRAQRFVSV
jgi:hypothetical protein